MRRTSLLCLPEDVEWLDVDVEKLTDQDFWNRFWDELQLPSKVDLTVKNYRVISEVLRKFVHASNLNKAKPTSIEIGCAPGKWMIYSAEELDYVPTGIEYARVPAKATEENLKACAVEGKVILADFFNFQSDTKYDLVMSFGFIEHFENYDEVFQRHLALVEKNGYLVLAVPRFRGIGYVIQFLIDPWIKNPFLRAHYLPIMKLKIFDEFSKKYNLDILFNEYVGGFERGIFPVFEIKNTVFRFIMRAVIKINSVLFGSINSSLTSGYQISVYRLK